MALSFQKKQSLAKTFPWLDECFDGGVEKFASLESQKLSAKVLDGTPHFHEGDLAIHGTKGMAVFAIFQGQTNPWVALRLEESKSYEGHHDRREVDAPSVGSQLAEQGIIPAYLLAVSWDTFKDDYDSERPYHGVIYPVSPKKLSGYHGRKQSEANKEVVGQLVASQLPPSGRAALGFP